VSQGNCDFELLRWKPREDKVEKELESSGPDVERKKAVEDAEFR
jgi:hypothetical protein